MRSRYRRSVAAVTVIALAALTAGCTLNIYPAPNGASPGSTTGTPAPGSQAAEPAAPADPPVTPMPLSQDAIDYARSLGGTSHEGKTLYFVIGASLNSQRAAQALLDAASPSFGDMQSYFIVQQSDSFEGMTPGYVVLIEAYSAYPSPENLELCRRGFPDAYVKKAIVRTDDPIPVYDEIVGP